MFDEVGPDILKLQIFTPVFCKELIECAEKLDTWSQGGEKHYDKRSHNIEHYPTQDTHMNQIGLDEMWKFVMKNYISPLIWKTYKYAYAGINMAFIVKYSMDGQKELRPHHDSAAFTTCLCLNNEFEGGGVHFCRQNQTLVNKDIGSVIVHPGRVTHRHQGLPISKGVRYLLISFNN